MRRHSRILRTLTLAAVVLLLPAAEAAAQALQIAPAWGWHLAGNQRQHYAVEPQYADPTRPGTVVLLASQVEEIDGFGSYSHARVAELHRGKRVRLSANLRAEGVATGAGLWFRVDGEGPERVLAFDNMADRLIRGTQAWRRYSVVLEVPEEATELAYGVLLAGAGKVWIEDVALEVVDRTVPLTGTWQRARSAGEARAPRQPEAH